MTGTSAEQTGGNGNRQFWIVQEGQPAGWRANANLVTGQNGGPFAQTPYTFRTPAMTAGAALESGVNFMTDTGNTVRRASGGIWQVSRDNPVFPSRCGIDVALIIDLSGSLSSQLQQVKDAANAMVNALEGTNSTIGVYTFAAECPGVCRRRQPGRHLRLDDGRRRCRAREDQQLHHAERNHELGRRHRAGAARGLRRRHRDHGRQPDCVRHRRPGSFTRFRETENGVFSANRLKAPQAALGGVGTRVIALGVGAGVEGAPDNLRAISGPTTNSDFFQAATFTGAAAVLRALALGNCVGSLTIVKQVVPAGNAAGVITGAQPAGGWNFTAASGSANVTIDAPATRATTLPGGAVNFPITYAQGVNTGTITVTEDLAGHPGFAIFPVGGFNGTCTASSPGQPNSSVPVTNTANGFTLDVPFNRSVSCEVYNQPVTPATLTLEKQVVNDGGGTATASQWTLTATNNGVSPINRTGTPVGGNPLLASTGSSTVTAGVAYTLSESTVAGYQAQGLWTCLITGTQTTVTVTNSQVTVPTGTSVTCRIVNNDVDATGLIAKTAGAPVQQPNGTWTQQYTVTVTNNSATAGFAYLLNDQLLFGTGITYASATVTGPGTVNGAWTGGATPQPMATGTVPAGVGATHVYTVTVTGIVVPASAAGTSASECQPGATPGNGGFLNRVQLFKPGATTPIDTKYACAAPAFPTVLKVGNAATQNPDASFNVSYTITVTNPSPTTAVQAALTDTFPVTPSGWTLVSGWTVTSTDTDPDTNGTFGAGATSPIWSGTLPAGTTYTFAVNGVLKPASDATPIGDCETGGLLEQGHRYLRQHRSRLGRLCADLHPAGDRCKVRPGRGDADIADDVADRLHRHREQRRHGGDRLHPDRHARPGSRMDRVCVERLAAYGPRAQHADPRWRDAYVPVPDDRDPGHRCHEPVSGM